MMTDTFARRVKAFLEQVPGLERREMRETLLNGLPIGLRQVIPGDDVMRVHIDVIVEETGERELLSPPGRRALEVVLENVRPLVAGLKLEQRLDELLAEFSASAGPSLPSAGLDRAEPPAEPTLAEPPQQQHDFEHCDRNIAKQQLLHFKPPAVIYLQAPTGYGKTHLLNEIARGYSQSDDWLRPIRLDFAQYSASEHVGGDPIALARALCRAAGGDDRADDELELVGPLVRQAQREKKKLLILFDHIDLADDQVLGWIFQTFLGLLQTELAQDPAAPGRGPGYRLILAGRRSARIVVKTQEDVEVLKIDTIHLHALAQPDDMEDFLRRNVPNLNDSARPEIARHLIDITQGHPGGMAQVVGDLLRYDPATWRLRLGDQRYVRQLNGRMAEILARILQEIDPPGRDWVIKLSVLRAFNPNILKAIDRYYDPEARPAGGAANYMELTDTLYDTCTVIESLRFTRDRLDWYCVQDMIRHLIGSHIDLIRRGAHAAPGTGLPADLADLRDQTLHEIARDYHHGALRAEAFPDRFSIPHRMEGNEFIRHVTEALYHQLCLLRREQTRERELIPPLADQLRQYLAEVPARFRNRYLERDAGADEGYIQRNFRRTLRELRGRMADDPALRPHPDLLKELLDEIDRSSAA